MQDVTAWVDSLGLGEYAEAFAANAIAGDAGIGKSRLAEELANGHKAALPALATALGG